METVTKEQLAEILNGREYGKEIMPVDITVAKQNNLVIVYGASDDLMEFEGAISEEFGTEAIFDKKGNELEQCEDGCKYFQEAFEKANKIKGTYTNNGWVYKTDIPHATFDIFEDGELYCKGLVFSLNDAK